MSDKTIAQLTAAGTLNATDLVPISQSGTTVKAQASAFAGFLGYGNVPGASTGATGAVNSAAIQAAIDAASAAGGGSVILGPGTYQITTALVPKDNVTLRGQGMGVTLLQPTGNNQVVSKPSISPTLNYFSIQDLTFYGNWQTTSSQGTDNNRHVQIYGVRMLLFVRVESLYSRMMGITAGYCDYVSFENGRILYAARDGVNFSTCKRVRVVNSYIAHCNDDAIAIHTNYSGSGADQNANPPQEVIEVSNNIIEDAFGIKCLGARQAHIAGNVIRRAKGYGVYTDVQAPEGKADSICVNIQDNVITDTVQASKFGFGVNMQGIYIGCAATSWVRPVVGSATPSITIPNSLWYLQGASSQNAGAEGINIKNNTISWTLPSVANYSTWGFDTAAPASSRAFTSAGWVDPVMTSGHSLSGNGISISGAFLSLNIEGNDISNVNLGVQCLTTLVAVEDFKFTGNKVKRFNSHGVALETSTQKYGRAIITGNFFDGDPYFESANRMTTGGKLDGRWNTASTFTPCAIDMANFDFTIIEGNTFRNVNNVQHNSGSLTSPWRYGANTYICMLDSTYNQSDGWATTASNRGIGAPSGCFDSDDARIHWEDSDPRNSTYGTTLGFSSPAVFNNTMPSSGYYVSGQTVCNRKMTEAGAAASKYVTTGWYRITTGNAHVLNTDWREMRELTGN